jgi:Uma2 family endonuclease
MIQKYFNERIAPTLKDFFRETCSRNHYFGKKSIVRPPLDQQRIIQPDIIRIINETDSDMQCPDIVFEIGD